jgi:hypothetical protein
MLLASLYLIKKLLHPDHHDGEMQPIPQTTGVSAGRSRCYSYLYHSFVYEQKDQKIFYFGNRMAPLICREL